MLNFARYRKNLSENELGTGKPSLPNPLVPELEKTINAFVAKLKMQMVQPTPPQAQRGVWDRMKGWWSNLWYGRNSQNNPYYWKNKLGDDMGRVSESTLMPLEHFHILYKQAILLEEALPPGTDKLQIMRTIDNWARDFKQAVIGIVNHHDKPVALPPEQPTQEEEPDQTVSKPAENLPDDDEQPNEQELLQQKLMGDLLALKGKMADDIYNLTKDKIERGENLPTIQAFLAQKRVAAMPDTSAPAPPPKETATSSPIVPEEDDDDDVSTPEPDDRTWAKLTQHEKEWWDQAGGGASDEEGSGPSPHAYNTLGIKTLPWILRIGDPRLAELATIRNRDVYRRLARHKRIENPGKPITNSQQLKNAVEIAKKLSMKGHEDLVARREKDKKEKEMKDGVLGLIKSPRIKTPRVAVDPDTIESSPEVEKLMSDLDSLKDKIEDEIYDRLKHWINSGDPERIANAESQINHFKDEIEEPEEDDHDKNAKRAESLLGESAIRERARLMVDRFRQLVNEKEKPCVRSSVVDGGLKSLHRLLKA